MRMQGVHWSQMQLEYELKEEIACELRGFDWTCNFLCLAVNFVVSHWNMHQSHKLEALTCFSDSPFSWIGHYKENFLGPECFFLQQQIASTLVRHLQSLVSYVMFSDISCDSFNRIFGLPCDCSRQSLTALTSVMTPPLHTWPLMVSLSWPGFPWRRRGLISA